MKKRIPRDLIGFVGTVSFPRVYQYKAVHLALERLQREGLIMSFEFLEELSEHGVGRLRWTLMFRDDRRLVLTVFSSKQFIAAPYDVDALLEIALLCKEYPKQSEVYEHIRAPLESVHAGLDAEDAVVRIANNARPESVVLQKATVAEDLREKIDFWILDGDTRVPVQFTTNSENWVAKRKRGVPTLLITKARIKELEADPGDLIRALEIIRSGYLMPNRRIEHIDIERLPVLTVEPKA